MATRETLRLAGGARVVLDRTVDQATRDLVRAWAVAWDELKVEWEAAIGDLLAASGDGQWPSPAVVRRAERANRALDATRAALEELAEQAGVTITGPLPDVVGRAAEFEARMIASQMPASAGSQATLTVDFSRVSPEAIEAIVTRTTQQITSTLAPLSAEATAVMNEVLIRGVGAGWHPREAAREMLRRVEGGFNGGLTRALTVARTEMLDAHRAAALAQDIANLALLEGWQWTATLSARTCVSCLSMHGRVFPVDEPGPLDHPNGRCARVPAVRSWRELGFNLPDPPDAMPDARGWFEAQPEGTQLQIMGPDRFNLWQAGRITWEDLAIRRANPGWRDSYVPTPVADLVAAVDAA